MYSQTFLKEKRSSGRSRPNLQCALHRCKRETRSQAIPTRQLAGLTWPIPIYNAVLAPYDLTRGGDLFSYLGRTDVKEIALYAQDQITAGNWLFNLGIRGDLYNGFDDRSPGGAQGGARLTRSSRTSTVLRASYARTLETPFNEKPGAVQVRGCLNAVLNPLLACSSTSTGDTAAGI